MVFVKSFASKLRLRISTLQEVAKYHAERRIENLRSDRVALESKLASHERFLNSSHVSLMIEKRSGILDSVQDQTLTAIADDFPSMSALKGKFIRWLRRLQWKKLSHHDFVTHKSMTFSHSVSGPLFTHKWLRSEGFVWYVTKAYTGHS